MPSRSPDPAARRRAAYERLLATTILENEYIPVTPYPKQARFLLDPRHEGFYGGAAGGGKSEAILMGAAQYVSIPNYAALILRRTYQDLAMEGAIMDRSHEWWDGTSARWSEIDKRWTFPSGATITFGYLQHERQKFRYKSAEFQFVGWDELTDFTETMYEYLFSRLRKKAGNPVPLRVRSASNPDGVHAEWVRERFVPMDPETNEMIALPPGRFFVPANLDDNPHLDQKAYERQLAMLDPVTFEMLRHGRWDVRRTGGMIDRDAFRLIDRAPDTTNVVRAWDLAGTDSATADWTVGTKWAYHQARFSICDIVRFRADPGGVERRMRETAEMDGPNVRIGIPQDPGQAGKSQVKHLATNVLQGFAVEASPESGSKEVRARPWLAAARNGLVDVVRAPWNSTFFAEAEAFPDGPFDDTIDACSRSHSMLAGPTPFASRL